MMGVDKKKRAPKDASVRGYSPRSGLKSWAMYGHSPVSSSIFIANFVPESNQNT